MHVASEINNARGVFFIGCGTAAKVCQVAEYIFSKVAEKHVNFIQASEFENYKHFLLPETLVIAISQSGETADVLDALKVANEKGSKVISIINVPESSIARVSDYSFLINAGPEKAVASTKATTAQMAVVILLAYACSGKIREGDRLLVDLAGKVNDMLNPRYSEHIKRLAEKIYQKPNILIIGRGLNYPMAMESAIKIMEISYAHAQGFAGGELKHGPIALIEKETPVIALVANDETKDEIISNSIEVKSRGAYVIGISPENNEVFDYWIKTPDVLSVGSPIVNIIPVQLLAYYLGILRGHNVDYPRSLAKSVTVK
ncbi:MAG: SIS domain-containing protein [archaeon]